MNRLLLSIYNLFYLTAAVFVLPHELRKRPKARRGIWFKERLGRLSVLEDEGNRRRVWVHAVSVGESIAARPLVRALRDETEVFFSTVTDTGREVAGGFIGDDHHLFYLPFDLSFSVRSVVSKIKPSLLIVMETEIWPSLLTVPPMMGVPVVMVNGRISDKSFDNYMRFRFLIRKVISRVSRFCMQSEGDAERIIAIGAPPERVTVTGNLKFDSGSPPPVPDWAASMPKPLIVAGSTHPGEEELVIEAFKRLKSTHPSLSLIIAPRHPERAEEVEKLLKEAGFDYSRRTELKEGSTPDLVILDTVGELGGVYGAGDICIVGGSFVPRGGHNILEPASFGKVILTGHHMENFPLSEEFFSRGGAYRVRAEELFEKIDSLLKDRKMREES
ncbi:MAG: 3-deoxy-D-manno-octulosonic acid transferase, partial [Nitrospirae bacterium]